MRSEEVLKFFVPLAEDDAQAERVYRSIAEFNSAPVFEQRVFALAWEHKGQQMSCQVGDPLPTYYRTGSEAVLAILACDGVYKVCTASRGGLRGEPVLAGRASVSSVAYFNRET